MLRRTFYKRARDEIAFCHRFLHVQAEPDSEIISKKEAPEPQNETKDWQDLRKNRLTASNFSRAIGFWPEGRRELWLEKVGVAKQFSGNEATFWDADNETEALERYKLLTGNLVIARPGFVVYNKNGEETNWLGASPDGLINGASSTSVVEVKCPFYKGGDGGEGEKPRGAYPWKKVPYHCIPQLQGLMEIVDTEWLDLYCWTRNGSSLFRVWRDNAFWEEMRPALVEFWEKHVVPAREIYNDVGIKDPHVRLREFSPKRRHGDCKKIMRRAEILSESCNRLFYEIDGNLVD
ncbi:hypothetical protein F2Q70_00041734 [Brassica cretica]|uniref:YqaJ viral recombinase domain-containing protein n=1 Tax=Brassica cretica TaxID=69181 RepID=A0A8S9K5V8_BRACR|nr:hypothetical protein F2Q70_00041734 [Brassica cretica]